MPTYQYACKQCGEGLEVQQSFTDDSLTECPACGGRLRKVYNAVGVVFKGSGFYRNDSRDSSSSTAAESSSTNGSGDAGKADAKSSSDSTGTGDGGSKSTTAASTSDSAGSS